MLRHFRGAFTLVELLVTIAIIAIVMSFAVAGMMVAQGAARRDRTQAVIAKLDSQLMIRWESYHTRRLPINATGTDRKIMGPFRLNALREIMRLEMPTRYEDIVADVAVFPGLQVPTSYLPSPPQISLAYLRRYNSNSLDGGVTQIQPTEEFQAAECLYMIVTMGLEDVSEGTELIASSFIGDADGDGMPEFHDGWDNPIHFVRWPAGYFSDRQPASAADSTVHDPIANHDPFDPGGFDSSAYALYPLISSAGPDEEHDIVVNNTPDTPATPVAARQAEYSDPYDSDTPGTGLQPGAPFDSAGDGNVGNNDNITNHLLGTR